MSTENGASPARGNLPDAFDRALDGVTGRPGTLSTKVSTIRSMPTLGVGGSAVFLIQTFRIQEDGERAQFVVFLERHGEESVRLVLQADVAEVIARQREALTTRALSARAVKVAKARMAAGHQPAFLRRKGGKRR